MDGNGEKLMVHLVTYTAAITIFSALVLLTVDRAIYKSSGWVREMKYASALGWGCAGVSLLFIVWRLILL
ncbi:hypothetical protein AMQ83_11375 [Paenibacillus riograndensis]|nr:hypothetical protein AMQ83_11375 [Paenibacillus riograndensis]